jgi:hypothetical protein
MPHRSAPSDDARLAGATGLVGRAPSAAWAGPVAHALRRAVADADAAPGVAVPGSARLRELGA